MITIILITIMFTACYFIIAMITAVYRQQQLNNNIMKSKTQQMIESILDGLFWPLIIISYATKKAKRRILNCLLIGIILLAGCSESAPYQKEKTFSNNLQSTALIANGHTIIKGPDGCDYIYWYDIILEIGGITHSGSCEQCWNRMDSLLKANKY
jgi:hypothetical protein